MVDGDTHQGLGNKLAALGPGGSVTLGFEDYKRLFGSEPTEDEVEGQRAAGNLAAEHNCDHWVDLAQRRVWFKKKA